MRDNTVSSSSSWTKHATSRFTALNPDNEEIDAVCASVDEALAGTIESSSIPFDGDLRGHFVFKCRRFLIIYRLHSKDAEIVDVIPWEDWARG